MERLGRFPRSFPRGGFACLLRALPHISPGYFSVEISFTTGYHAKALKFTAARAGEGNISIIDVFAFVYAIRSRNTLLLRYSRLFTWPLSQRANAMNDIKRHYTCSTTLHISFASYTTRHIDRAARYVELLVQKSLQFLAL